VSLPFVIAEKSGGDPLGWVPSQIETLSELCTLTRIRLSRD